MSITGCTGQVRLLRRVCGALAIIAAACGPACTQPDGTGEPCAQATITAVSEDANNFFDRLQATACALAVDEGVLTLDIVDESTGSANPRILFTLPVAGQQVPTDTLFLDRQGIDLETQLPPALYQEIEGQTDDDPPLAVGPFWSAHAGTITFATTQSGTITGEFNFTADNPPTQDPNEATGEIRVSGSFTIMPL